MKATASYKMSKQTKTSLALGKFKTQDQRNGWKRSMIDAELSAMIKPKTDKGRKKETEE